MNPQYYSQKNSTIICNLCPHNCIIEINSSGICGVRHNINGLFESAVYGQVSAISSDPIEKKPLYHFYPGADILSIGSFGCNLCCNFCQNHHISQVGQMATFKSSQTRTPEEIVYKSKNIPGNIGVAFTYNEPTVWYEFMFDTARLIKEENMVTAMVSNGYINTGPLKKLLPFIDAFNIDLKSFDDRFYRDITGGTLNPVLNTLKIIAESGKHLEVTNLVIPGLNDNLVQFKNLADWINSNCGSETVLHLSKYFPNYNSEKPVTPDNLIVELYNIAKKSLKFTYLGNTTISEGQNTYCPDCSELLISRSGYKIEMDGVDKKGNCRFCMSEVFANFSSL